MKTRLLAVLLTAAAACLAAGPAPSPTTPLAPARVIPSGNDPVAPLPKITAASFVLADADTGAILAARDPHGRRPPASTLKMLTAITLLPRLKPDQPYVAQHADAAIEGSKVGLAPGHVYKMDDLWRGLFLRSGNDAASAVANAVGGVPIAVELMREEAARLQARDTTVVNTSGLDEPGQLSSAYDLTLFARAGLARPDFRAYCGLLRAKFPHKQPGKFFDIGNQNALLRNYAGAIGVKTGFTSQARYTFVGAATRGGRTLIVTLMRIDHPWVSREAGALLDWGFANADRVRPVETLAEPLAPAFDAPKPSPSPSPPAALAGPGLISGGADYLHDPALVTGAIVVFVTVLLALLRIRVLFRRRRRGARTAV